MARVLAITDGGAHTGFAQAWQAIGDRLVDRGHEVSVLAANYRGDYWPTKMRLYPANLGTVTGDVLGFSRVVEMLAKVMPEVVVILNDPHAILNLLLDNRFDSERVLWNGGVFGESQAVYRPPILAYMPIDGYDSPKSWDILGHRVTRIAMSKFGRDTAMPEAPVVWHGIDTSIYKPMSKTAAKRTLGYDPDRFLILRVDKNSTRKDYPATWKALRPLLRKHSDIDVHFHCLPRSSDGYDLRAVMFNDEDIRDRVSFSPNLAGFTGWSDEMLATLYSAADLFVSTSWGEGFGLGNLSAIACGTPVVAQDCSATTEVVGPGGVLVPPKDRITTPMGQDQCLPDIEGFTAAIERLYLDRKTRRQLGEAGVAHAAQFSWDWAAEAFDGLIRQSITKAQAATTAERSQA